MQLNNNYSQVKNVFVTVPKIRFVYLNSCYYQYFYGVTDQSSNGNQVYWQPIKFIKLLLLYLLLIGRPPTTKCQPLNNQTDDSVVLCHCIIFYSNTLIFLDFGFDRCSSIQSLRKRNNLLNP